MNLSTSIKSPTIIDTSYTEWENGVDLAENSSEKFTESSSEVFSCITISDTFINVPAKDRQNTTRMT